MKVLHIFDCAAVGAIIMKEQRKAGIESDLLTYEQNDPGKINKYYGCEIHYANTFTFGGHAIEKAKDYDVLHLHFIWEFIPMLKKHYPDKKIIMHYHGSDVRQNRVKAGFKEAFDMADARLCDARDVMQYFPPGEVTEIVAPVDTELFKPTKKGKGTTMFMTQPLQSDKNLQLAFLDIHKYDAVRIMDRTEKWLQYKDMPEFLSRFDTLIDVRYQGGKLIDYWSTTACQALALGLDVIDWLNVRHKEGLDDIYKSENILEQIRPAYESITH